MRMKAADFASRNMELHATNRDMATRQRDKIDDGNIKIQRTTVELNQKAGKDTNAADMEQGLCTGGTTALLTAAGVCACFFPVGTIIGACLAAIAVGIMIAEAVSQKDQRDDIADINKTSSDLKVTSDANTTEIKHKDEQIKAASDDLRAYVNQQIENMRREYDALHGKE